MNLTILFKAATIALTVACASCSSAGQSGQKSVELEPPMQKTLLDVGVRKPDVSESVSSTVLQFFVVNNTSKDVDILIWGTPFEKRLSADIFTVSKNGVAMPYLGRLVKRGKPSPQDYMKIDAGATLQTYIDIASYYDMSASGQYTVQLKLAKDNGGSRLNQETTVALDDNTVILSINP